MVVTELAEVSRARYKVYIDQEFAFVVYKGELLVYGIELGEEIQEETYREIMTEVLPKRAKLRSMNLLAKKAYTEKQLRDKLQQGFYPEECIRQAVDYVKSYCYIDDDRYAREFVEYNRGKKSIRRMENDLLQKGIRKENVKKVFEELAEEGLGTEEEVLARKCLEKKHYDRETATLQETGKMYAFLYRKGFSPETIQNILKYSKNEFYLT